MHWHTRMHDRSDALRTSCWWTQWITNVLYLDVNLFHLENWKLEPDTSCTATMQFCSTVPLRGMAVVRISCRTERGGRTRCRCLSTALYVIYVHTVRTHALVNGTSDVASDCLWNIIHNRWVMIDGQNWLFGSAWCAVCVDVWRTVQPAAIATAVTCVVAWIPAIGKQSSTKLRCWVYR